MHSHMFKTVLQILARRSRKFIMTPDVIKEVLKSREAEYAVNELKMRGHAYGVKADATDKEIQNLINNGYRYEVVSALSMLKPKGCVEDTKVGRNDSFQKEILNLGTKMKKGEVAYRITELGLLRLKNLST